MHVNVTLVAWLGEWMRTASVKSICCVVVSAALAPGASAAFPATIDLGEMDQSTGFSIPHGGNLELPRYVHPAGDINGDCLADFVMGDPSRSLEGVVSCGSARVLWGPMEASDGPDSESPSNGVFVPGRNARDLAGWSVGGVGDINGDSFDDFVVNAFGADPGGRVDAGENYLIYGLPGGPGVDGTFAPDSMTRHTGTLIAGTSEYYPVSEVRAAGDLNADGYDDMLLPASNWRSYIVYGREFPGGSDRLLRLGELNGVNGVRLMDTAGISSVGDYNGDGHTDLLWDKRIVFHGQDRIGSDGSASAADANLLDGLTLQTQHGNFAIPGGPAGDFNGDGLADLLLQDSPYRILLFGRSAAAPPNEPLSTANLAPEDGLRIYTSGEVWAAGDVNADGYSDILINDSTYSAKQGISFLLYGKALPVRPNGILVPDAYTFAADDGVVIRREAGAADQQVGVAGKCLGDINADGVSDFFVVQRRQPAEIHALRGQSTSSAAAWKSWAPAGDAPLLPVGHVPDFALKYLPESRILVDFANGQGSGAAGASVQTATFSRSAAGISNLANAADGWWRVQTDRTGWNSAELVFLLTLPMIRNLDPGSLVLATSPNPDGPWQSVANHEFELERLRIRATVSSFGYFAVTGTKIGQSEAIAIY